MRTKLGRWTAAALLAAAAAGCASGGGQKSVLDLTWGWGWDLTGSGTYPGDGAPATEGKLDYYREHVRTEDAAGAPVAPVDQVVFLPEAPPNRPVGEEPPAAGFVDVEGRPVRLEDYRGKKNLVLVFTRGFPGYLCPLCTSYTAQIAHRYPEIRDAGGEVLLVFPGPRDQVGAFVEAARAIQGEQGPGALPYPVLLDTDLSEVTAFGILGDLARPSTFVVDRQGRTRYAFVGDMPHERPDVDVILAELRRLGKGE